jgi:hypothetical protein
MIRVFLFFLGLVVTGLGIAQTPTFNTATPINFHNPPYNYLPYGRIEDVMEVDSPFNQNDGFLAFGVGKIYSPLEVFHETSVFSIKYDQYGNMQWANVYEEEENNKTEFYNGGAYTFYDFIQTDEGILGLICEREVTILGYPMECYITYFDYDGAITQQFPLNSHIGNNYLFHSIQKRGNELLTTGKYRDSLMLANAEESVPYINAFDLETGNLIWERYFEDLLSITDHHIDNNEIWLLAYAQSPTEPWSACWGDFNPENGSLFVVRLDNEGNELARLEKPSQCNDLWTHGAVTTNNRLVVFGKESNEDPDSPGSSYNSYFSSEFVFVNDEIIEVGPHKTYMEGRGFGEVRELLHHEDGSFTQAGWHRAYIPEYDATRNSGYLMRFNEERDSLWYRNYGYYNNEPINGGIEAHHRLSSAKITSDGGFVCVGNIEQGPNDPQPNLETPWIFKVDEFGCLEPGCQLVDNVDEILTNLNGTLELSPNPASSFTKVKATLPSQLAAGKHIEIAVHSAEGRQVFNETLQNEVLKEGKLIRVEDFTSGMYYVSLVVDGRLVDMETLVVE